MVAMTRKPLGLALQNAILPGDQPNIGMGDFPAMPHALPQAGQPEKPGFFKEGGMGRVIAGLIGDALLQQGGMRPVYSPMMQQRQQADAAEAQWSRQRMANREDKLWEAQNIPKTAAPHYWETNDGSLASIGPDGKPQVLYKDPTPKMNFIPDGLGGGQWVSVPTSAPTTPSATPRFGPVVDKIPGGPASAPGNFLR